MHRFSISSSCPRIRPLLVAFVLVAAVIPVVVLGTATAEAYPNEFLEMANCGFDSSITYRFKTGVPSGSGLTAEPWTTNMKDRVRDGINIWDSVENSSGTKFITTTETSSGEWDIYSVSDLGDFGGLAACNSSGDGGYIALDFRKNNGSLVYDDSMEGLAAHEIGHAIGVVHTGINDSWYHPTDAPTMEGCAPMQSSPVHTWPNKLNTLEDDDFASAVAKTGNDHINPNPSFEHGSAPGWKKTGGSWTAPGSGGVIGPRYLTHTGYNHDVYNRVRLYDLTEDEFTGSFRVGVRYREPSGQTGNIKLEFWAKTIAYSTATGGACEVTQFPDSKKLNDPSTTSTFTLYKTSTLNPSTVWSGLTWTSYKSFSSAGADFEIRVVNLTETTGPLVVDGTVHVETGYVWPQRS